MDKEIIDKQIKNEIELVKIKSAFVIGLVTAIVSFVIRYLEKNEKFILILLIASCIFLFFVLILLINSYIKIINLTKKLKK
ncbi:MAG: hypothetical protein FVQ77_00460 [Cytophagales bacterium]|nr:hypothetical protein [Cytophagales bacterium]